MAFKGTSINQDSRFKSKELIDASSIKLPEVFKVNIDISKIEIEVIKHWIDNKLSTILEIEDDSLAEYFYNILLEDYKQPLKLYSMMNQFLEKATIPFLTELWQILDSCQNSELGISHLIIQTEFEKLNRNIFEIEDKINICNNIVKLHKEKVINNGENKFSKEKLIGNEHVNSKDCKNNVESSVNSRIKNETYENSNRRNYHLNNKDNKIRNSRKSRDQDRDDEFYYSKYNKDSSNDRDDRYCKYSDYKTNKDRSYSKRKYRYSRDRYNCSKEKDRERDRNTKYYSNKHSKYNREQRDHYRNFRDYSRGRRRSSCSYSRSCSPSYSYSITSRYSRSRYSSPVTVSSRSRSRRRSNSYHKNSRSRLEAVKQTIKKINK